MKETRCVLLRGNLVEATVNTTFHDADATREEIAELLGFLALNLSELHWEIAEEVIQFDGLVGSSALLVLRAL